MRKTIEDLGILQIGMNYICETQRVGEIPCSWITQPTLSILNWRCFKWRGRMKWQNAIIWTFRGSYWQSTASTKNKKHRGLKACMLCTRKVGWAL